MYRFFMCNLRNGNASHKYNIQVNITKINVINSYVTDLSCIVHLFIVFELRGK